MQYDALRTAARGGSVVENVHEALTVFDADGSLVGDVARALGRVMSFARRVGEQWRHGRAIHDSFERTKRDILWKIFHQIGVL